MSQLRAKITDIKSCQNLNIVSFNFFGTTLTMMSLELKEEVQIGKEVLLGVKATSIAIAKNFTGEISYSNQISTTIQDIEIGQLLCSINLKTNDTLFESVITSSSAKRLKLKKGDKVCAFIKASEISILKILDA